MFCTRNSFFFFFFLHFNRVPQRRNVTNPASQIKLDLVSCDGISDLFLETVTVPEGSQFGTSACLFMMMYLLFQNSPPAARRHGIDLFADGLARTGARGRDHHRAATGAAVVSADPANSRCADRLQVAQGKIRAAT